MVLCVRLYIYKELSLINSNNLVFRYKKNQINDNIFVFDIIFGIFQLYFIVI